MACVVVPLALRFLALGPADLGLPLDGRPLATESRQPVAAVSRATLLRTRRFATISLAFAFGLFAQIGVISHLVARLARDSKDGASAMLSLTTACAVIGRIVLGWKIGGHDRRAVAGLNFVAQAVGVLLLGLGANPTLLVLGCILFGLGVGNLFSLPPLIAQSEFEPADAELSWRSCRLSTKRYLG